MLTTLKPGFYLGIDGGGTKTEAVITTETGYVVGRGTSGGANPHNYPIDVAFEHIRAAINNAITESQKNGRHISKDQIQSTCLGLAGIDTPTDRDLVVKYFRSIPIHERQCGRGRTILCNDGFIGLKSAIDDNWGICLISSTGSNCYGVSRLGHEATAGDWGFVLGDQGSGYALGVKIIHRVIKEYDGRRPKSILTPTVLKHLGLKSVPDLIPWAYGGQVPVREIASLSQIINIPEIQYSIDLSDYVNYVIKALVESYRAVVTRLDMFDQKFPIVLIGGMFNLSIPFKPKVRHAILEITPKAQVVTATHTPAEGAARVAQMGNLQKLFPDSVVTFINPQ